MNTVANYNIFPEAIKTKIQLRIALLFYTMLYSSSDTSIIQIHEKSILFKCFLIPLFEIDAKSPDKKQLKFQLAHIPSKPNR